jgi:hypothetical protein
MNWLAFARKSEESRGVSNLLSPKEIQAYRKLASLPVPPIKLIQRYLMAATESHEFLRDELERTKQVAARDGATIATLERQRDEALNLLRELKPQLEAANHV